MFIYGQKRLTACHPCRANRTLAHSPTRIVTEQQVCNQNHDFTAFPFPLFLRNRTRSKPKPGRTHRFQLIHNIQNTFQSTRVKCIFRKFETLFPLHQSETCSLTISVPNDTFRSSKACFQAFLTFYPIYSTKTCSLAMLVHADTLCSSRFFSKISYRLSILSE